jgi:hypothetical protein
MSALVPVRYVQCRWWQPVLQVQQASNLQAFLYCPFATPFSKMYLNSNLVGSCTPTVASWIAKLKCHLCIKLIESLYRLLVGIPQLVGFAAYHRRSNQIGEGLDC